ncbi:CoA ester lyase [Ensifer sp. ENS05]|uniref:HpcH/HpaI aldolase/citrate lyase family protein n=1 Tax=Ensifer sp. ENS05 TaxID=2769277 RepID=UPI001786BA1E|nr:CoA ester lyase [Ensifer sp. ENS05]MBD9597340.1 CoA ester lyase [Ensifer sp. ENS05]
MMLPDFTIPLFVPGDRPERFEKAAASGADAVIIDLEDAVAPGSKDNARGALQAGFTDYPILVRVNGEGTPWHVKDVSAVFASSFAGLIIPKAEMSNSFADLAGNSPIPIIALIESARGLSQAREIAALAGVSRLFFGSVDFCADMGCSHTRDSLLFARSELVLASRLAGLVAPVDGVTTSIVDADEIASDAKYALQLGFGGKLAIHPRQIEAIQAGFRPDSSEIEWARRVVASGEGATAVDGAMVDEPVRIRARNILRRIVK